MRTCTAALAALALAAGLSACADRRPSDEELTPGAGGKVQPSEDIGSPDDTELDDEI